MYYSTIKAALFAAAVLFFTHISGGANASTYLQGQVTARGSAYTNTSGNVYLSCSGTYWASDWAYVDSSGNYSMDSSNYSYSPCGSYNSGRSFSSCEVYAYPAWNDSDATLGPSDHYPVTIDCSATTTQDIELNIKDKTIAVSVTAGNNAVTSGVTVYCSQQESPWTYSYISSATDGVYNVPVVTGHYYCSAYCSDWTNCTYAGYPSTYVTVASSDSTVSAALSFAVKDKTIEVAVTAGSTPVTSDITVYCSQRESPWAYSYTSTATSGIYSLAVTSGNYYCSAYCSNWNSCPYSGYPSTEVTVASSDSVVSASIRFTVKDKTLNVAITADGDPITSGVSVYASEQGGGWSYSWASSPSSDGRYSLAVGEGRYYVSAYCSNWTSCEVSGYPNATVDVEASDSSIDMTLTFLKNNATFSGVVTDGTSGLSNVGVSVYSYRVGGGTGVAWSISPSVSKATITAGTSGTTMVSAWVSTDSSGAFQVRVPAGTYTVSVWPPWDRSDLGQASIEATAIANSTTSLSIALPRKTAVISGIVSDTNGNGVANAYISGWSYNGTSGSSDWFWRQTDSSGAFSVYAIQGLKYNVSAYFWSGDQGNTICNYNNEGMQTVVASSSPRTVNFTFPICDCALTVNTVDSSGSVVSSIYGGVNASPVTIASGEMWYGIWGSIWGGTGTLKVQSDVEYKLSPYIWDTSYVQGDDTNATCTSGATSVNLTLLALDATISGGYKDGDGNAVTLDQYSYLYVYSTKGNAYRSCQTSSSGYSCQVSSGRWCLGYWIDSASGYASASPGSATSCISMSSGGSESRDLTLLKTGTIAVTLLNADGSARANSWVEATPYSNQDRGGNSYQYMYMSSGCMTDNSGACTITVGAASGSGTVYYVNAYIPYYLKSSENITNPDEVSVTVIAGESVSATLTFKEPDGTSVITVAQGSAEASLAFGKSVGKEVAGDDEASSPVAHATVDCFSVDGGSFEVETDETGVATCPCATTSEWKAVAYNIVANNLWMSEATDITCTAEGGVGSVTVNNVATLPEGKSVTISDVSTETLTIELSDGFSVFFPTGSLGTSGQATCNVDVTVTPFTANRRPASFYGYTVSCQDGNGSAIVQLNSNASFSVPVNQGQVENVGLTMDTIEMCYHDDSTGAYAPIPTATIDDEADVITYQQNHLTSFAVVGNGNLAGIAGEEAGEEANEHGEEEGGGETGSAASSGGGCGCQVASEPPLAEKLLVPMVFLLLIGARISVRFLFKKIRVTRRKNM